VTPDRLASLAELLDRLGSPAMVIGGLAVAVRGRPRMTRDADVTIGLDKSELPQVLAAVGDTGFAPRTADPESFVAETGVLPLSRRSDGWEVDLIFAGSPYEHEAIARASRQELQGVSLPVISAEDLVIHKLVAGRPRDIDDAEAVIARQGERFDRAFVRELLSGLAEALADDDLRRRAERLLG
jgi:hypothetical protein